jgi:hypothetical protein
MSLLITFGMALAGARRKTRGVLSSLTSRTHGDS